jgi:hypothetical protein
VRRGAEAGVGVGRWGGSPINLRPTQRSLRLWGLQRYYLTGATCREISLRQWPPLIAADDWVKWRSSVGLGRG